MQYDTGYRITVWKQYTKIRVYKGDGNDAIAYYTVHIHKKLVVKNGGKEMIHVLLKKAPTDDRNESE
jgi:hypothetical protein